MDRSEKFMSDTPRTDANEIKTIDVYGIMEFVDADFARILERELAGVTKERDEFKQLFKSCRYDREKAWSQCDSLQSALRACAEALNKLKTTARHAHECYLFKNGLVVRKGDCSESCEMLIIEKALSLPAVQAVLKHPTQCHQLNKPNAI
jgi:hypothetical protein